jgi:hypothetical protein
MTDRIDDIVAALPPTSDLHVIVDFDGTLSEIVATPDLAVPVEGRAGRPPPTGPRLPGRRRVGSSRP